MSVSMYEQHVEWSVQGQLLPIPGSWGTQTIGSMTIPTTDRPSPSATVAAAVPVVILKGHAPARAPVQLEQWLDLWISRRYAGGALPVTLDATQAINRDVLMFQFPSIPITNLADESTIDRMVHALKRWTGASTNTIAHMLGVRVDKDVIQLA